jgi:hypothetical protein
MPLSLSLVVFIPVYTQQWLVEKAVAQKEEIIIDISMLPQILSVARN